MKKAWPKERRRRSDSCVAPCITERRYNKQQHIPKWFPALQSGDITNSNIFLSGSLPYEWRYYKQQHIPKWFPALRSGDI